MVVDELHMVADGDRGIGLEMSLSKLMFSPHARHVQVIGMSATSERQEGRGAWLACVRVPGGVPGLGLAGATHRADLRQSPAPLPHACSGRA